MEYHLYHFAENILRNSIVNNYKNKIQNNIMWEEKQGDRRKRNK